MAIKAIIVDVLNKLLSDYVENVDAKQIFSNISLLGGDIALDDLVLKQSVLDELNLPVKTAFGRLGKLNLTIPSLTNLYTAPWIVCIERLFLLSVPNEEVNYDDEKEERLVQEAKQKEIAKVEETKRIKELLGTNKQENAGFMENLVAHIVKNVQVTIKDIHIRYEDRVTNPGSPFSLGITLSSLKLVSTDEKGKPADAKQSLSIFHKVLDMEGLAFYWNPNSPLYASYEEVGKLQKFQSEIATKTKTPDGYNYMFGPISATAQLQLNQKPEQDGSGFTIPKIQLDMNMNVLSIGVSKMQYRDLVKFLESMDRMARGAPYRKYRPLIDKYKGHSKTWSWKFAFKCVVKTEVRRKQKNGNWNHIRKHRDRCKRYEQAYTKKLLGGKKPSADVLKEVAELEKVLDVFNIILLRQRAELKVQKTKKVEEAIKKETSYLGRFVGWLSGDESYPNRSGSDIANKIDAAMTKEEKQKLYEAIGYQENAAPVQYPQFFVAIKTSFNLGSLQIVVYDEDIAEKDIAKFVISGVQCTYEERPSAKAIKAVLSFDHICVKSCQNTRFSVYF